MSQPRVPRDFCISQGFNPSGIYGVAALHPINLGIPGPATGVIWAPSGRKLQIESENGFPGPPGPGAQKVQNGVEIFFDSKKSQNRLFFNDFDSFSTLFGRFGPRGQKGTGTHFRTLFATFAPKGPNDPCSGQKFSRP